MRSSLAARLVSATLILVVGAGGGGLPSLDLLLYHLSGRQVEAQVPHYEASSACHADRCAVRSTAQESRFAPLLPESASLGPLPEQAIPSLARRLNPAYPLPTQHLSRAPPSSA